MIQHQRGRIVNISSGTAVNANPFTDALGTSKAALTHWTRCLAMGMQAHGVGARYLLVHRGQSSPPAPTYLITAPEVPMALGDQFCTRFSQGEDTSIDRAA